jgi:hypothetical protein
LYNLRILNCCLNPHRYWTSCFRRSENNLFLEGVRFISNFHFNPFNLFCRNDPWIEIEYVLYHPSLLKEILNSSSRGIHCSHHPKQNRKHIVYCLVRCCIPCSFLEIRLGDIPNGHEGLFDEWLHVFQLVGDLNLTFLYENLFLL